jgi:integrase
MLGTNEYGGLVVAPDPIRAKALALFDEKTSERLRRIVDDGTPPNTKRAYASDMKYFWAWCAAIGWTDEPIYPVPAEVVARFIADHIEGLDDAVDRDLVELGFKTKPGRHAINTVDRRVSTLSSFHKTKGIPNPCATPMIITLMSKARKAAARRGEKPRKKKAAVKSVLDQMIETCATGSLLQIRDEALLLFGFSSGGRRRSEIVGATMENLEAIGDSYLYVLGVTKTDQEGEGATIPVTGRAAIALRRWLDASKVESGHIFRGVDRHGNVSPGGLSGRTVARIVQDRAKQAGLNGSSFGGHSLRSGFLTEVGLQGKSLLDGMALSRHKTVQVAAGYHQAGAAIHNKTASLVG